MIYDLSFINMTIGLIMDYLINIGYKKLSGTLKAIAPDRVSSRSNRNQGLFDHAANSKALDAAPAVKFSSYWEAQAQL